MEQARYLMWAKRKTIDCSNTYVGDSWEEQAFAEDAAGSLGCVWPPRSYSCSFCRREFRSAQALGGHMNVHRRDRARLKQQIHPIINPHDESARNHHHATIDPCSGTLSFDAPFIHNSPISHDFLVSNPKSVIRESSPPPINVINSEENTTSTLSFFSPNVQKTLLNNIAPLHPQSWSSFVTAKKDCTTLRQIENWRNPTNTKTVYSADEKKDCLSEKLNLVVSQTQTISSSDVEEVPSRKRRRMEADPLGTFFTKLSEVDHHSCNLQQSTHEELDLELRLGDAPKVKQKRDI